jgi:hypothetical protein
VHPIWAARGVVTYVDYSIDRLMAGQRSLGPQAWRRSHASRIAECMLEMALPVLKHTNYRIVLPETAAYNCIAWAAGDQTRWWHPYVDHAHCYWPLADAAHSMANYIAAFETVGYRLCGHEPTPEPGIERVALYRWPDIDGCTHAARQLPSGVWTSKINDLPGIAHLSPSDLDGAKGYGRVVDYMSRLRCPRPKQRVDEH